jgi:hypothetical protein
VVSLTVTLVALVFLALVAIRLLATGYKLRM